MLRHAILLWALCGLVQLHAQASLTAIGVTTSENFNSLPNATDGAAVAGWANNTTLTGLYCTVTPVIEATCGPTAAAVNNAGNAYVIASGSDRSFGARPSNATGIIRYGMRYVNSTGSTISSLYIAYNGEQWSIAENGANVNQLEFSYQTGTTVTSLTAGVWTVASTLSFTQVYTSSQSAGLGGSACGGASNQCLALNGNLSTSRRSLANCITVSIAPGEEIMLRWTDLNDASNDHHLQIDDLEVTPYTVSCLTVLPVEFSAFTATLQHQQPVLNWTTASEKDNAWFEVERSFEGGPFEAIGRVNGNGNSTQPIHYQFIDRTAEPGVYYYRLRQVDYNGAYSFSELQALTVVAALEPTLQVTVAAQQVTWFHSGIDQGVHLEVRCADGRLLTHMHTSERSGSILLPAPGLYLVRLVSDDERIVLVQKVMN